MKKQLFLIVSILVLCIGGCGKSNESSSKESIFESNEEVDAFADIKVTFEGFSGQGTVKIDTSSCDKTIKEHIEFKYDTSVDGKLENEQIITISAVSNNKKYTVLEEEQTYVVNGLFAFAKDIGNYLGDFSDGMAWFRYINPSDGKAYLAYMDSITVPSRVSAEKGVFLEYAPFEKYTAKGDGAAERIAIERKMIVPLM